MSNLQFFGALAAVIVGTAGTSIAGFAIVAIQLGSRIARLEVRLDRIEDRLTKVEDRLTALEVTVARIGQHLEDHIEHHPGRRVS